MVGNLSLFRIAVYETETRKKPSVRKIKRVTQRWENFETVLCSCRFNSALIPSFYPPFFSSLLSFFLSFLFFVVLFSLARIRIDGQQFLQNDIFRISRRGRTQFVHVVDVTQAFYPPSPSSVPRATINPYMYSSIFITFLLVTRDRVRS